VPLDHGRGDDVVIEVHPERLEHAQCGRRTGRREREAGVVAGRQEDLPGETEHRVHETRARVRLEDHLVGGEPDEGGDGPLDATGLLGERHLGAEARPRLDVDQSALLFDDGSRDRTPLGEVEVPGFVGETRDEVVDAGHGGLLGGLAGCPP
jgi:hypothetical protein